MPKQGKRWLEAKIFTGKQIEHPCDGESGRD